MQSKLNLDRAVIDRARASAARIAMDTQGFIDKYTTVSVERAVCRLLGVDGITFDEVPLPNIVVDHMQDKGLLPLGAARCIGGAMSKTGLTPQQIAEGVGKGELDLADYKGLPSHIATGAVAPAAGAALTRIRMNARRRNAFLDEYKGYHSRERSSGEPGSGVQGSGVQGSGKFDSGKHPPQENDAPYLYVIVATGNIYEDIVQASAAARQGADVIAVIRTTGQSLLDYVPYGATTEGFGGTFATQENFRLMRSALDEVGAAEKRYIRLCNYCSGLCMPEIAAMGAFERLDMMLNDALYGILFRDINMQRTVVDQYFSRVINSYAGVIINTGEDNYLTTADAVEEAHTVLASQFINEQFALKAGLREEQQGLGHAFEIDPEVEDGFLMELAQAQMAREIFPKAPLKYMPPTKFITGNIFMAYVQNALFNAATVITGQKVHLLGMLTEAVHTPFLSDRALAIDNARYIERTMRHLGDELVFIEGGRIQSRAAEVLGKAASLLGEIEGPGLLGEIEGPGLFAALEKGVFAGIKRRRDGGKGLAGVVEKDGQYFNPFLEKMKGGPVE